MSSPAKAGDPVRRGGRAYEKRLRLLDPRFRGDDDGMSGGDNRVTRVEFWRDCKMDFDLSEEQRLLKESVDGLLGPSYDFEQRKKSMPDKGGCRKSAWSKLAEQGLLPLPFSEHDRAFAAAAVGTLAPRQPL